MADFKKLIGKDSFRLKAAPITGTAITVLFAMGIIMLPADKLGGLFFDEPSATFFGGFIFRLIGFAVLLWLLADVGFKFKLKIRLKSLLAVIPFFIIAVNNLPIIALAKGDAYITAAPSAVILFAVWCLSVSLIEETAFRGLVLPFMLIKTRNMKYSTFWAVVFSSALFGLMHLVNMLSNPPLPVLLQIGYSFLIGAMCGVAAVYTRSLIPAVLLHAVYNFCGLLIPNVGAGALWDTATVILTVVLAVTVGAYVIFILIKTPRDNGKQIIDLKQEEGEAINQDAQTKEDNK